MTTTMFMVLYHHDQRLGHRVAADPQTSQLTWAVSTNLQERTRCFC